MTTDELAKRRAWAASHFGDKYLTDGELATATVENNQDIPPESVEAMIQSVSKQIRKGYAARVSNQN